MAARAAPKLKEAFAKLCYKRHDQVARLQTAFEALGQQPEPKSCKGMAGLIEEGEETIRKVLEWNASGGPRAHHCRAKSGAYEIAGYGTPDARASDWRREVARLLSHTLVKKRHGSSADKRLRSLLLQDAALEDMGANLLPRARALIDFVEDAVTPHSEVTETDVSPRKETHVHGARRHTRTEVRQHAASNSSA
jgi:ferritin-like metal-binding protein YciE